MTLLFHLRFSGLLLILLGVAHAGFGRRLNWKLDLAKLTLVNRQIFLVHCFYIALLLVMMGCLSLFLANSLLQPQPLPRAFLGGMTLIWSSRLFIQWRVFDQSLWRDDRFNRRIHYLFSLIWTYLMVVDAIAFAKSFR